MIWNTGSDLLENLLCIKTKPFITDMWDAVIIAGKQSLLDFKLFRNIQCAYSWIKYYYSEFEWRKKKNWMRRFYKSYCKM